MVAEVIVDIAGSEVDRIFEYTAIEGVHPGCRVRVPFGGRVIDGYVMRLKEESEFDPSRLKPVAAVVDEALTPECLQLAEALAARYHCPKAQVLRLFLPAEMRRGQVREKQQTWVLPAGGEADISPRAKAQAAADLSILIDRRRRCMHLHLPDNTGVTLRALGDAVNHVLFEIEAKRTANETAVQE